MGENQDLICSNHRLVSDVFRHDIVFAFQIIWRECLYHADPRTLLLGNLLSCSLVWVIPSLGKWFMLRSTVILKKIETSLVIYLYIHRAYSNLVACTSTVSLVGVAVFHVVGTRACQPSKTLQNLPQVSLISPKHKDITSMLSILCGYQSCGY